MYENIGWLDIENALYKAHNEVCCVLGNLLGDDNFISSICHGMPCASNGDGCYYKHDDTKSLGANSKAIIVSCEASIAELTLEELYYYLNIAYQNYVEDGQYPETIKLFADGLEYFRKACNIKGIIHKEASGNHKKQSSI